MRNLLKISEYAEQTRDPRNPRPVSLKSIKKRLKKIDRRLGGRLLVRLSDSTLGHLYVDMAVANRHMPGMVRQKGNLAVQTLQEIEELVKRVDIIHENVSAIRDSVCA